jgi:hypothetical protein
LESKVIKNKVWKVWVNICRFLCAFTFIFSGFVKAVDPIGNSYKIQDYFSFFHLPFFATSTSSLFVAMGLSTFEFWIGAALLFGVRRKSGTFFALAMMVVLTPVTFYLALKNPITDCGCFGDALKLTNWDTFYKNVILLVATLSLYIGRKDIIPFLSEKLHWICSIYMIAYPVILGIYCFVNLPILDFRPYKIGTNICKAMSIPENAKRSVYKTEFILEKNGVQRTFSLENYPDSTWMFVDSKNTLVEKGYEPLISDFSLENSKGEDVTQKILSDKNYTFLLIAYHLEEADDDDLDLINSLYDYCREHNYAFYCVTSSGSNYVSQWQDRTGAEYPFLISDEIPLKTMVRSNPGLMLIRGGVIINKWNHNDIPDMSDEKNILSKMSIGHLQPVNDHMTIVQCIAWFFIPFIVLIWLDLLIIKRVVRKKKKLINPLINK